MQQVAALDQSLAEHYQAADAVPAGDSERTVELIRDHVCQFQHEHIESTATPARNKAV